MENLSITQWFNIEDFVIDTLSNSYKVLDIVGLDEKTQIYKISSTSTGEQYLLQCFKTNYQNYSQMKRRINNIEGFPPIVYEPEKFHVEIMEKSIFSFLYKLTDNSEIRFNINLDIISYKKFLFSCLSYLEKFSLNYYLLKESIIKINNSYYFLMSNIDNQVSDNTPLKLLINLINALKISLGTNPLFEVEEMDMNKMLKYMYELDSELYVCDKCNSIVHVKDEKSLRCKNNCNFSLEIHELRSDNKKMLLKNEFNLYEDFFLDNGNYDRVIAKVSKSDEEPNLIGLTNLSGEDWFVGLNELSIPVKPHRTLRSLENLKVKIFEEVYTLRILRQLKK